MPNTHPLSNLYVLSVLGSFLSDTGYRSRQKQRPVPGALRDAHTSWPSIAASKTNLEKSVAGKGEKSRENATISTEAEAASG